MLIPLSVYFATDGEELVIAPEVHVRRLTRWFWRSCFSERYSGQTVKVSEQDTGEAIKLRADAGNSLGDSPANVAPTFFLTNQFRMNTAKTATFILLLASQSPRSFISGNKIS